MSATIHIFPRSHPQLPCDSEPPEPDLSVHPRYIAAALRALDKYPHWISPEEVLQLHILMNGLSRKVLA